MARREYGDVRSYARHLSGHRVYLLNALYLVSEHFNSDCALAARRIDIHDVPSGSESAAGEIHVVSVVLYIRELSEQARSVHLHARPQADELVAIRTRTTQSVYARDRCDYDDIPPLKLSCCSGVSELIYLIINVCVLLYIHVRRRDVGLRLIIVVVRNEILDGVVWEELLELSVKLSRQGFVVRNYQGRFLHSLYDFRHSKSLAGAGHSHQGLCLCSRKYSVRNLFNRLWLIAGRLVFTYYFEFAHFRNYSPSSAAASGWLSTQNSLPASALLSSFSPHQSQFKSASK